MMLQHFNYSHNKKVPLDDTVVINGQGCGEVAKMKYGFFNMSYNGCEMIALHNSMLLTGRKSSLKEICRYMYPRAYGVMGIFGSNPVLLGTFYKKAGIRYRMTYDFNDFFNSLRYTPVAVISFWNPPSKPFHGIHTVTVQLTEDEKIKIYNRYNNKDFPYEYADRHEFMPDKTNFICGYLIEERM